MVLHVLGKVLDQLHGRGQCWSQHRGTTYFTKGAGDVNTADWRSQRRAQPQLAPTGTGAVIPPVAPFAKRGRTAKAPGHAQDHFSKQCAQVRSCSKKATNLNICTHGNIPPSHQTVQGCDTHTATLCSPQKLQEKLYPDRIPGKGGKVVRLAKVVCAK